MEKLSKLIEMTAKKGVNKTMQKNKKGKKYL